MGVWLLVAAGLIVLFVAYQLWGTALVHWQGQRDLRSRFDRALAEARATDHGASPTPIRYPAVGDPMAVIVIPRIGLDQVVVEGVGTGQLAVGPGHYPGTALPGQPGNSGIAGHRTTHGAPFNALAQLVPGDPVVLTTLQGSFTYRVTRSQVVAPDDVAVLRPTVGPRLTLTTCNPKYSAAQRLVVEARPHHAARAGHPCAPGRPGDRVGHGPAPLGGDVDRAARLEPGPAGSGRGRGPAPAASGVERAAPVAPGPPDGALGDGRGRARRHGAALPRLRRPRHAAAAEPLSGRPRAPRRPPGRTAGWRGSSLGGSPSARVPWAGPGPRGPDPSPEVRRTDGWGVGLALGAQAVRPTSPSSVPIRGDPS